jgi:IgGFc binding protein
VEASMRYVLLALGFIGASGVIYGFAGCSSKCTGFDNCDNSDGGNGTDGPSGGPDGNPFGNQDSGDGSSCALHCSGDLHDVLDCNNNVVTMCGPDQGCGGSGCVAACDAAKANKSSVGCDYYSIDPDIIDEGVGACFAAYVANTWNAPVALNVTWGAQTLNVSQIARVPSGNGQSLTYAPLTGGMLQPNQVAILFLARYGSVLTSCPTGITPGVTSVDAATHGTGIGTAFHITSDHPVVAYDIFPYGGGQSAATSATLLIPSSAWDVNYIGVNAYRPDQLVTTAQNFLQILANQDNTTVTINPVAAITGGNGVSPGAAHTATTYTLQTGQYLQLTQSTELTGSAILANNPIGVWGGATCLNIDVTQAACDSAHQQFLPVSAMGNEYVGVRYRNRSSTGPDETPPWRIVGAVDGTTLSYDPAAPAGAPTALNRGQVAEFPSAGPFVIKSQDAMHPFYVSAHMTGGQNTTPEGRGDPEFVNVVPPAEYLPSYVFFTDPTYSETDLVVVRQKGSSGFADVNLDCAGNLTGWQPLDTAGNYEYTRQDLVTGNFQPVGTCNNGLHTITSTVPFGLTVWGWGTEQSTSFETTYVSYAYPAGASVQPINTVVVNPNVN